MDLPARVLEPVRHAAAFAVGAAPAPPAATLGINAIALRPQAA